MDVHCRDADFKNSEVVGWKQIVNTVVYHTQSLRPKSQSVDPPWREKTKLRESDLLNWFCFGSNRQCLLRLCCALGIILTWIVVIVIPHAFLPSLMVLQ